MNQELTDRDEQVLEYVDDSLEEIDELDDPMEQVAEMQDLVIDIQADVRKQQNELERFKKDAFREINRIKDRLNDEDVDIGGSSDDLTKIERFIDRIPRDERPDVLDASEYRATIIAEDWWDIARKTDAGWVISTHRNSTRKHSPSEVKIQLQDKLGEDVQWPQIYRAMKMVAKMSGGEYTQDEYGRDHVYGGAWEYHEKTTPDATDDQTYKLLELKRRNSLTLL